MLNSLWKETSHPGLRWFELERPAFSRLEQNPLSVSRLHKRRQTSLRDGAQALFFRAAGHDMRQPLQTLAILIEILRRRANDADLRSLVDRQDMALWSTRTLLDGFLDACRLDAGVLSPSLHPVALDSLLKGLDEELREQTTKRAIRLRFAASGACVMSDAALLQRCLVMLVAHFMAMANGVCQMLIGCRRRGSRVRVEVWCTGGAVDAVRLAGALQESPVADGPWHGLPLVTARRCAQALDAEFEVRRVGDNTMCALTLPRAAVS
jgi:K+-sensing histidine kinase KdpD